MNDKEETIKYYELFTEYGSLLLYEKYKNDSNKLFKPEIYEFFTGEKATRGNDCIKFFNNNYVFNLVEKNYKGEISNFYYRILNEYEFLVKIAPYVQSEELMNKKISEVYYTLHKELHIKDGTPKVTDEFKNEIALLALKKYIK